MWDTWKAEDVVGTPVGDEDAVHLAVSDEGLPVHLPLAVLSTIEEPGGLGYFEGHRPRPPAKPPWVLSFQDCRVMLCGRCW
jgi:hypothetical protein